MYKLMLICEISFRNPAEYAACVVILLTERLAILIPGAEINLDSICNTILVSNVGEGLPCVEGQVAVSVLKSWEE